MKPPRWRRRRDEPRGVVCSPTPGAWRLGGQVNGFDVLAKVAGLPVYTWRYSTEPHHVRHLGPMAQDWKATFDLGDSETTICVVDAFGVALVAIQALNRRVNDLESQLARQRTGAGGRAPGPARRAARGG